MNTPIPAVLVNELLSRRGNTGGWGYRTGGQYSAEATALATLAGWQRVDAPARTAILDYWKSHQLPDGGWSSIAPLNSAGNWPTAIIANTLAQVAPRHPCLPKALKSLVAAEPGEAFWLWRQIPNDRYASSLRSVEICSELGIGQRQLGLRVWDLSPASASRPRTAVRVNLIMLLVAILSSIFLRQRRLFIASIADITG